MNAFEIVQWLMVAYLVRRSLCRPKCRLPVGSRVRWPSNVLDEDARLDRRTRKRRSRSCLVPSPVADGVHRRGYCTQSCTEEAALRTPLRRPKRRQRTMKVQSNTVGLGNKSKYGELVIMIMLNLN